MVYVALKKKRCRCIANKLIEIIDQAHISPFQSTLVVNTLLSTLLYINPESAEVTNLNCHPLEVVSRGSKTQLQVDENYPYLFNLRRNICKSWCLNIHFTANDSYLTF